MFLADGLFPGWKQPNEKQLELIAGAFAQVHQKRPLTDEHDFQSAHALLQWSSNLGRWDILHELILICHPFYAASGRSSQLIPFMEIARDHLSGEERSFVRELPFVCAGRESARGFSGRLLRCSQRCCDRK
jgi:hypothetical protein